MIDGSWTLFLDRDGVLNQRIPGGYVRHWEEFVFLPGNPQALAPLSGIFGRIVVVTNQQGIGKGLMSRADLEAVHRQMQTEIRAAGGRIDGIYCCPYRKEFNPICRKPRPGLAYEAKADFPDIDFSRSVLVGDSLSDIRFGKNLDMRTVLVRTNPQEVARMQAAGLEADWAVEQLQDFVKILENQ